jgi:hypothetical protein
LVFHCIHELGSVLVDSGLMDSMLHVNENGHFIFKTVHTLIHEDKVDAIVINWLSTKLGCYHVLNKDFSFQSCISGLCP